MLTETTLSSLARGSFFVASNVVYKPTNHETNIRFENSRRTNFYAPFATLDEIERFDIEDRFQREYSRSIDQELEERLFAGVSSQDSTRNPQNNRARRKIVRHILTDIFPKMYSLGASTENSPAVDDKVSALQDTFSKLEAKYGPVPEGSEDITTLQAIESYRRTRNLTIPRDIRYASDRLNSVITEFPQIRGSSTWSALFSGNPYFVSRGNIFQIGPGGRENQRLKSNGSDFGFFNTIHFDTLQTEHSTQLTNDLSNNHLDRLEDSQSILEGIPNTGWYIDNAMRDGEFEWDFVGFFIHNQNSAYVYKRVKKFALIDPYHQNSCFPFGEARIGLQVAWNGRELRLGNVPVFIDNIDHPSSYSSDGNYPGICNNATYPGDAANRISEGVATIRHCIRGNLSAFEGRKTKIPTDQARREGYELYT